MRGALFGRALAHVRFLYSRYLDRRFDRRYGVETLREHLPEEIHRDEAAAKQSGRYQPTSTLAFREMVRAADVRHEDFAFVDLGSGKGKTLMLAAAYPFRSIVGVELSPALHEIAEANLDAFLKRDGATHRVELRCQDAAELDWPEADLFVYLFNAFACEKLDLVLESLDRSLRARPRRLVLLCRRLSRHDVLERHSYLREVVRAPAYRIYRGVASED